MFGPTFTDLADYFERTSSQFHWSIGPRQPSQTATVTKVEYRFHQRVIDQINRERRESVRLWLEAEFGERCPEHHADCIVCQKWEAFDRIFGDLA